MLEKIYYFLIIVTTAVTITASTVSAIMTLQKRLRDSIEELIDRHEKEIKKDFQDLFLQHYYPLDTRIKQLNARVKKLEE